MFRKWKLKRQINACKKEIEELEAKRSRSQSALVEAILSKSEPNDADVDYFNKYTTEIHAIREKMHNLQMELGQPAGK